MYERQDKNENRKNTVILFSFFTVLTIIINIVSQAIFIKYYAGLFNIQLQVLFGTSLAMPVKYLLDKCYIFNFDTKEYSNSVILFGQYSFMGLFTTGIFWVIEFFSLRYLGQNSCDMLMV